MAKSQPRCNLTTSTQGANSTVPESSVTDTKVKISPEDLKGNASEAVALLKALSHECRLIILCHLVNGEMSVSELNETVPLSQSALSQHLARLRNDGIVAVRKEAQTVYYRIDNKDVQAMINLLYSLYCRVPE